MGKHFVVCLSTTKTTKILPPEKYPLYSMMSMHSTQYIGEVVPFYGCNHTSRTRVWLYVPLIIVGGCSFPLKMSPSSTPPMCTPLMQYLKQPSQHQTSAGTLSSPWPIPGSASSHLVNCSLSQVAVHTEWRTWSPLLPSQPTLLTCRTLMEFCLSWEWMPCETRGLVRCWTHCKIQLSTVLWIVSRCLCPGSSLRRGLGLSVIHSLMSNHLCIECRKENSP